MFRVEKKFEISAGHRLSKNSGICNNFHGHSYKIYVGVKSETLNSEDMVIDFSDLKKIAGDVIKNYDHRTLLNENDILCETLTTRKVYFKGDPTTEKLAETIYINLNGYLSITYPHIKLDYVKIKESDTSTATYSLT